MRTFRVRVTDPLTGFFDEAAIAVKLRDIDEAPLVIGNSPQLEVFSGTTRTVALPGNLFRDPEQQALTYVLQAKDGGPLPAWVTFDTQKLEVTLAPDQSLIGPHELSLVASDPAGHSASIIVKVTVLDGTKPWHNAARPLDVNRDGFITPLDALLIINLLNSQTSSTLPASNTEMKYFYDTSGDNFATPIDALLVINAINSGSGEGEAAPLPELKKWYWWS